MNKLQFKGREVILWIMPDGEKQPFYLSTGRNSGMTGTWLPFDGYRKLHGMLGWFIKDRFCSKHGLVFLELHRFGEEKYKKASEEIAKFFSTSKEIHPISATDDGLKVNDFLIKEGWKKGA